MRVSPKLYSLLMAGAAVVFLTAAPLHAQQPTSKSTSTHAGRSRGSGADENIKTDAGPNQPGASIPAPPSKGGARARGTDVSIVHADNRTSLYVKVYLDGAYCGTLSPWGDLYCYVGTGNTTMYARADYTDGTFTSWGPIANFVDGTFTWRLWP